MNRRRITDALQAAYDCMQASSYCYSEGIIESSEEKLKWILIELLTISR